MSQTEKTRPPGRRESPPEPSTAAVGFTFFAAMMMGLLGIWWVMTGLSAVFNDDLYVVGQEYVFQFDITTWGWIHLLTGAVLIAAAIGLYSGAVWARVVGVVMASLGAVFAFAWLPWYPGWALLFVGVSIAVIWALTVHGRDITQRY
jgi:hypothetical protein